jgi:UDP-N-acetyl-D-mannosaminuronic acid dehydrogenase
MHAPEKVCVVGLGYIGLPTAVVLAQTGMQVAGVDVREETVERINQGKAHIVEPDLDGLLHHVVREGRLRASTTPEPADVFVIAVPTPFRDGHVPDLSYVEAASRSIAPHIKPGNLVVLESTVPPGATEQMVAWILEERPDLKAPGSWDSSFYAAHCPERVLPGRIIVELVENDRAVGGITAESSAVAKRFYETFVRGECVMTTARTAELAKLAENAYRDVNIAFANELSMIADRLDVDPWELISLANRHPRVNILQPGPGVGGHCIAVDPWFIVHAAPEEAALVRAAREANLRKTAWVVERVLEVLQGREAPVVACFGLSYKPDIDDLRESPSVAVVEEILEGFDGPVLVVEPHVSTLPASLARAELVDLEEGLARGKVIVGLVPHRSFRTVRSLPEEATVMDPGGVWRHLRGVSRAWPVPVVGSTP